MKCISSICSHLCMFYISQLYFCILTGTELSKQHVFIFKHDVIRTMISYLLIVNVVLIGQVQYYKTDIIKVKLYKRL